jgi:DNA-directed RNA polymerase subunit F
MNKATVKRLIESVALDEQTKASYLRRVEKSDAEGLKELHSELCRKASGSPQRKVCEVRGK